MDKFQRQEIFINSKLQKELFETKIAIFGIGLGSIIAECLLRLGINNLTIIDGDVVELSNLNRQNYTFDDISRFKSDCLENRLKKIYPDANINAHNFFLDESNIENMIKNNDIIINTIDFDHSSFLLCNKLCKKHNVIEIFPMNIALGCSVIISNKDSISFNDFFKSENYKDEIINYVISKMVNKDKLEPYLIKYNEIKKQINGKDPQIGIGSYLNAALIATLIVKLIKNNNLNYFPFVYNINLEFDI